MRLSPYLVPLEEKQQLADLIDEYLPIHCHQQDVRKGPESVAECMDFPSIGAKKPDTLTL
jgi:hypothetical protein